MPDSTHWAISFTVQTTDLGAQKKVFTGSLLDYI